MEQRVTGWIVSWACVLFLAGPTFAQGGASIWATVVETAGGRFPGVTVVVTNQSGVSFETATRA